MDEFDLNYEELYATFIADAKEDIAALEAGLLALEETPNDAELRRELLRHAHTLKGNASCVGFDSFAAFAHTYEAQLESADALDIPALLNGIDTFRKMLGVAQAFQPAAPGGRSENLPYTSTLRLAVEKLDRMLDLAGEIAILRGRVQQIISARGDDLLVEVERQIDQLQRELQELIMRARMVPVGPLFRQYARTVRDLASAHGKNARLVTRGEDVELDTTAVELLRDPLTHMIRNAIDHGIELPEVRAANGKSPIGTITLDARHEAGTITIRISDDGAGLDRGAIAARARSLGMDDSDRLIFEPGFTTSSEVTDMSGRGVGMDVVRRAIESLRGSIAIETSEGRGTTFTLRLPLTLAMIDGFGVAAGDETWIVPMEHVVECVELPDGESRDDTTGVLLLRDEIVPWVRLRKLFEIGGDTPSRENVLVVQHGGARAGFVVDELHGAGQAVIKPLGNYFEAIPGIAGSSILGSGRVALILDTATIVRNLEMRGAA
ncbi:MAG: chemotaxis protein CheA [Acidobacteria bacterium]|nr:MAG: chemotaxis protein CheA [Acidobacteriota bacterium]